MRWRQEHCYICFGQGGLAMKTTTPDYGIGIRDKQNHNRNWNTKIEALERGTEEIRCTNWMCQLE